MNKKYDSVDSYRILITKMILKIAPIIAISAAATFTLGFIFGVFQNVNLVALIVFDLICLSYFIPAHRLLRIGIIKDGEVDENRVIRVCIVLDSLVLLQWNLISYIFPNHSLWGYAPMFVLLTAFLFRKKTVLLEIIGISISIAISWLVLPNELLPSQGADFLANVFLRIIALIISFSVIYILTSFSEKFTGNIKHAHKEMEDKNLELSHMTLDIMDFSAEIIEERDSVSGSHVKRIKKYTNILAKQVQKEYPEYELTDELIEQIGIASALHDIGKIGIPDSVLLKPGRLTPEEFEIIKKHTLIGADIIDKMPDSMGKKFKLLCKEICMFHHEKYDGKGYPTGLLGDEIPISAQIVSVVDCFDALSTNRPYKCAYSKEESIKMILNGECGQFSDKIKKCIIDCKDKLTRE